MDYQLTDEDIDKLLSEDALATCFADVDQPAGIPVQPAGIPHDQPATRIPDCQPAAVSGDQPAAGKMEEPTPRFDQQPAASNFVYDSGLEEEVYTRALLSPEDLINVKEEIARNGFMSIEQVRGCLTNIVKISQEMRGETLVLDPELMFQIDIRINYRIFIAGDDVYTYEELCANFPFDDFKTSPERIFVQQEIGEFDTIASPYMEEKHEYLSRDVGGEFTMIHHMDPAKRIVRTKIYIGKERWDQFMVMTNFFRAFKNIVAPALGHGASRPLLSLFDTRGVEM